MQFCKENFPGHPAIVCTPPDGHNSAGNIHVHIVIGSLRVRTVERQPFMDKPCDWEAGKKHRCTSAMLRHLRVAVMEMCEQADLNQINLLKMDKNLYISYQQFRFLFHFTLIICKLPFFGQLHHFSNTRQSVFEKGFLQDVRT